MKKSKNKKVIIVGAGVAGLACAIRLSIKGYDVNVFEANGYPGGKLSSFELKGLDLTQVLRFLPCLNW